MSTAERLEQLRDLPRVTVADRERYKRWEQESRADLAEAEPEHSQIERAHDRYRIRDWVDLRPHRTAIDHADAIRRDVWRSHWRSLPDYDGPPMRAPSGTEYWTHREIVPFEHAAAIELGITQEPDDGRKDEYGVARYANWYMENFWATRLVTDCFDHPSTGGRGWCPKLAEAGE